MTGAGTVKLPTIGTVRSSRSSHSRLRLKRRESLVFLLRLFLSHFLNNVANKIDSLGFGNCSFPKLPAWQPIRQCSAATRFVGSFPSVLTTHGFGSVTRPMNKMVPLLR